MTVGASSPAVWTSLPDRAQTDRVYLGTLGTVTGLRYGSQFPGGSKAVTCALAVDPLFTHRALTPGRDMGVTVAGCDIWQGTLIDPTVNDDGTRQITGDGDATMPGRFVALGLGTHNALNVNEVIDAAQLSGRHARFSRDTTLPVPTGAMAGDGAFMIDEVLTQNATAAGKRWRVDLDRVIRFYPSEGTGERLILLARQDPGRTMDGQVTRLDAAYIDSATGLRNVEHLDADPADTGSTVYPAFYKPDDSGYASGGFTLYSDGTTVTAYVIRPPATTTVLSITSPAVDLTLAETSQFYARFTGPAAGFAVGMTGRAGTYRATSGGPSLGTGSQENSVQPGLGSLGPTGTIAPREQVIDLTSSGAFTLPDVLTQLRAALAKQKVQPHYTGQFTVSQGDLLNAGGVPVDLATVQAGVQVLAIVTDPTRTLSGPGDTPVITIGEVEYDVDTATLTMTPVETPDAAEHPRYVDPLTGLAR